MVVRDFKSFSPSYYLCCASVHARGRIFEAVDALY